MHLAEARELGGLLRMLLLHLHRTGGEGDWVGMGRGGCERDRDVIVTVT